MSEMQIADDVTTALAAFVARVPVTVPAAVSPREETVAIVAAAGAAAAFGDVPEARAAAAVAIGCEVAARLRDAVRFDPAWDAASTVAILGAVAAAAHALALDAGQARNALGIAATQATGLVLARATMGDAPFRKVASDALEAAVLAQHGFTAAPAALEGRRGLVALMASGCDTETLLAGLGEEWRFVDP